MFPFLNKNGKECPIITFFACAKIRNGKILYF